MMTNTTPSSVSSLDVLIVEDDAFQRAALAAALDTIGIHNVSQAADGHGALQRIATHERGYDVVICDLQMEGMDGVELIRHAAKKQIGGLILLSAMDDDVMSSAMVIARARGVPVLGKLSKPLDLKSLKKMIVDADLDRGVATIAIDHIVASPLWSRKELACAIQNQEFIPYFQPKIDLISGAVAGVEMLARWNHPEFGVLPPSQFIPHLEAEGLIGQMTESLFHQALACCAEWQARGLGTGIALNASASTLQNVDVTHRFLAIAEQHKIAPTWITIELTESVLTDDLHGLQETLTRLRMAGFGVSLDDFGAGFTSLQRLSDMPFSELKIDRAFITGNQKEHRIASVLDSIASLSRTLRIRTVAEGIESPDDLKFVRSMGCDVGQGYYFSKPLAHADWMTWHANHHATMVKGGDAPGNEIPACAETIECAFP